MPHDFQISRNSQALFITLNSKDRLPVFRKDEIKRVLCDAIDEARKSAGLLLFAYVVMIDQLHLVTNQPKPISEVLSDSEGNYSAACDRLSEGTKLQRVSRKTSTRSARSELPLFALADRKECVSHLQ